MCTVLLPPGDNTIAVKYISYHIRQNGLRKVTKEHKTVSCAGWYQTLDLQNIKQKCYSFSQIFSVCLAQQNKIRAIGKMICRSVRPPTQKLEHLTVEFFWILIKFYVADIR
jgi:hypothetical protein